MPSSPLRRPLDRRSVAGFTALLLLAAGCRSGGPARGASATNVVVDSVLIATDTTYALPDGIILPDSLRALGARVSGLRAVPDTIRLRVGERFAMRELQVLAVDSAGRALGPVIADTEIEERTGIATGTTPFGSLTALKPGMTHVHLVASAPRNSPAPADRPTLDVPVVVRE